MNYNQQTSNYGPAVTDNLMFSASTASGIALEPMDQTKKPLIEFFDSKYNLLNGREPIAITDKVVKYESFSRLVPQKLIGDRSDFAQIIFEGKTPGFVKARNMFVQFTCVLSGNVADLSQLASWRDTIKISQGVQAPYCMLNNLREYDGYLGPVKTDMTLDRKMRTDRVSRKAIACLRPRTMEEHKRNTSLGLPCSRSSLTIDFTDADVAAYGDNKFVDILGAARALPDFKIPPGSDTFTIEHHFTVQLADLFPFLDSEQYIPPDTHFYFEFKFDDGFGWVKGNGIYNRRVNSKLDWLTSSRINVTTLLVQDVYKNFLAFDYYTLHEHISAGFSNLPPVVTHHWDYRLFQDMQPNRLFTNGFYTFNLGDVPQPTSVIIYFTGTDTTNFQIINYSDPTKYPHLNLFSDQNGFTCGLNLNAITITMGGKKFYDIDNINFQNTVTLGSDLIIPCNNEGAYCVLVNQTLDQQYSSTKPAYRCCPTRFNQINNVIPAEFYLQQQEQNDGNIRALPQGKSDLIVRFAIKGKYYYYDQNGATPIQINDALPPNTIVNILTKYSSQIIITKDQVASRIAYPYYVLDASNPQQPPVSKNELV